VDDVDLHAVEVDELAVVGDPLHRQQPAGRLDDLAHGAQRPAPVDADLGGSGSHQAPRPSSTRPDASSSRVANVAASRPTFLVQIGITPAPTLIRRVTAANAAIGTVASRTSRLSACQTASKPHASAWRT
jgi:hypothetical protein